MIQKLLQKIALHSKLIQFFLSNSATLFPRLCDFLLHCISNFFGLGGHKWLFTKFKDAITSLKMLLHIFVLHHVFSKEKGENLLGKIFI